jgi:DNA helicase II / ATP-dependent DNA helicase PcrA
MNRLTLAVAGGRKTQSIVDNCRTAPKGHRILVLTYTQNNQRELVDRLACYRPLEAGVEVQGWFSFLLGHWVRPYLPVRFPGRRLRGLNFDGDPGRFAVGESRFLDNGGRAYKLHLAQLALETHQASSGSVLDRLGRIYHEIHIDEVQDLNGYDLEVLSELMASPIDLNMVGDVRQALIQTNIRDPKNKQYKGIGIKAWFEDQQSRGHLAIFHEAITWRSNQLIADFADTIFNDSWGFARTVSRNAGVTGHDGMFAISPEHVSEYVTRYSPLCVRYNANCCKSLDLPFMNIGIAKGLSVPRVLIGPTTGMINFLRRGKPMGETPSCSLYVAVTRARFSVAFVADNPALLGLTVWTP